MKKIFLTLFMFYIIFTGVIIPYGVQHYAPLLLKKTIGAEGRVGFVFFNPFTFEIQINNFFIQDNKKKPLVFFKSLYLDFDTTGLFHNEITLQKIAIDNLFISIKKYKNKQTNFQYITNFLSKQIQKTQKQQKTKPSSFYITINNFILTNASFSFENNSKKIPFIFQTTQIQFLPSAIKLLPHYPNEFFLKIKTNTQQTLNLYTKLTLSPLHINGYIQLQNLDIDTIFHYLKENTNLSFHLQPDSIFFTYDYKQYKNKKIINIHNQKLNTTLHFTPKPFQLDAKIQIKKLNLTPYNPILQHFTHLYIQSSLLTMDTDLFIATNTSLRSNISLENINIKNSLLKKQLLLMKQCDIQNLIYKNNQLKIDTITLLSPQIEYNKSDKKFNNILIKKSAQSTKPTKQKKDFHYYINHIILRNANVTLQDNNTTFHLNPIKSDITTLSSDKNTPIHIKLKAILNHYTSLQSNVQIFPQKPFQKTNIHTQITNLNLPLFSPYINKYIGNDIKQGKLNALLEYNLSQQMLHAQNHITIQNIALGKTIKSPYAIKTPTNLALDLLKDSNNNIVLNIPVDGNVSDPNFHISDVFLSSLTNIFTNVISSPFTVLSSIMGFNDKELSTIQFPYGSSTIPLAQTEKLDKIIKILQKKPYLILFLQPSYTQKDESYIKEKETKKQQQALQNLAKQRAINIKKYLLKKGIKNKNIKIIQSIKTNSNSINFQIKIQKKR
ncbi:putative exported protein [hydrothermal vent metagenome]|uniref:Putative exported protein n=1 Tax=hydrothermal vent metagenome TaxID=652676 RepID=A0A1W1D579_9ZZZZ